MLECSACTLRAIRAIAGDSLHARPQPHPRLLLTPRLTHRLSQRAASTTAVATTSSNAGGEPYLNAAQIRHHQAKDNLEVANEIAAAVSASQDRAIKKELRWLQDPLKFAEHVHYTLRCDNPDKALALCRTASKEMNCVVAWNHVVDWHMRNQKINEAINIYNEMKKRAQFPDSYTYVLLLRGFVGQQNHHRKAEVKEENAAKAVSIYNSMSSPTSRVTPTIMHTNAALRVCSFAFDTDAFWGVASKIPDHGPGSADHITYTLIFQAIRHAATTRRSGDVPPEQVVARNLQAVHEAKKVWHEVVQKWRSGEVKMDEELVCSMAKVLLLSNNLKDWDDVLSLIQQTMAIQRLAPPVGSPERHTEHVPQQQQLQSPTATLSQEDTTGYSSTPAAKIFNPVQPLPPDRTKPSRPTTLTHVAPGNATLSVLIEACGLMRAPKLGTAYWTLLTTAPYSVTPDLANFHAQLRLHRNNRSSTLAAHLLTHDLPRAGVPPKNMTFRMAMAVCARDTRNPHVLENARQVVDCMERSVTDPDVMTLKQYLGLAIATDDGGKIVRALDRLDSVVHNLRSLVTYGGDGSGGGGVSAGVLREQVVGFLGMMVGTIDTLMNRGMVPREDFTHWHGRRSQLTTFIGRAKGRLERVEERRVKAGEVRSLNGEQGGNRMGKGSWELMMFRKRNAKRRQVGVKSGSDAAAAKGGAWGAAAAAKGQKGTVGTGLGRAWVDGRKKAGGKDVDFADSPAQLDS